MKKLCILAVVMLGGCESIMPTSETVYLAKGEQAVVCGPYKANMGDDNMARADGLLRACVSDFQRQGYQRVAVPTK